MIKYPKVIFYFDRGKGAISMEKIRIELTNAPKAKPNVDPLPFGKFFSDHMFLMNYEAGRGWYDPRIVP